MTNPAHVNALRGKCLRFSLTAVDADIAPAAPKVRSDFGILYPCGASPQRCIGHPHYDAAPDTALGSGRSRPTDAISGNPGSATCGRPWTPAFAGATVRDWDGSLHFESNTEDLEGSPRRCGLIVSSMGSICAEKAFYGLDAAITNPAKSGRASGPASRGMRTASCDFIFGAVPSSAVQDRSGYKRLVTVALSPS